MTADHSLLHAALAYATRGFRVIPLPTTRHQLRAGRRPDPHPDRSRPLHHRKARL
jgi:hypothetical protein